MDILTKCDDNILEVTIQGEIDHHTVKEIRAEVDALIELRRPELVLLKVSGVDFMDSSGLGLILGRYKKVQEFGGELRLINPSARILKVLKLAGADRLLKID